MSGVGGKGICVKLGVESFVHGGVEVYGTQVKKIKLPFCLQLPNPLERKARAYRQIVESAISTLRAG